jgi:hypothetical protein
VALTGRRLGVDMELATAGQTIDTAAVEHAILRAPGA